MRTRWGSWSKPDHVRRGTGNADLSGGGSDGHAQGLRRPLWAGARPFVMRAAERAHLPVHERATQPPEATVLGWQRAVGLGKNLLDAQDCGTIQMAKGRRIAPLRLSGQRVSMFPPLKNNAVTDDTWSVS